MSDIFLQDDLERLYGERDIDKITELFLEGKLETIYTGLNNKYIDLEVEN